MYICPLPREQLLHFLPQGLEIAEVGVSKGEYSAHLLQKLNPKRLHLIDPWTHQDDPSYQRDVSNFSDVEHQSVWEQVNARFCPQIESGQVSLLRELSHQAVGRFDDGQLGVVYIDAVHTRDGVAADLEAYLPKVAEDGFILGHDYTNQIYAQRQGFGVIEAVNEFVERHKLQLLALTNETWATYVIVRRSEADSARRFVAKLLYNVRGVVELEGYPTGWGYRQVRNMLNDREVFVPRFTVCPQVEGTP